MMKRNGGRQVTVDQDGDIRDLPGGVKAVPPDLACWRPQAEPNVFA